VPAHGALATRAELVRYREMLKGVSDRVAKAVAAGQTVEQVVAAKPAGAWRAGMEGGEDRFVTAVYEGLQG
jgi:hypothetical protein